MYIIKYEGQHFCKLLIQICSNFSCQIISSFDMKCRKRHLITERFDVSRMQDEK